MACADLLLIVLASATLQIADTVYPNPPLPSGPSTHIPVGRPIDLALPARVHTSATTMPGAEFSSLQFDATQPTGSRPSISVGPLRAEFGGTTGRHMHLATVKVDGFSVFGGSIGGSIDSRSARITLSWPTGN